MGNQIAVPEMFPSVTLLIDVLLEVNLVKVRSVVYQFMLRTGSP
jgi:hypothetical protein